MDWTDLVIVIRNEPSPSRDGSVRTIGRTRDGEERVIGEEEHPMRSGTLVALGDYP